MNKEDAKHGKPSNESSTVRKILEWVGRLSTHFSSPQDEEQIRIFVKNLEKCSIYQIETGFERCLNECEFMPRLKQFHERMPEEREKPGVVTYKLVGIPFPELIRPFAQEVSVSLTGIEFEKIDPVERCRLRSDVVATANRLRQWRNGVDTRPWGELEFQTAVLRKKYLTVENFLAGREAAK